MHTATGFQIAFLVLAFQFFSILAASFIARRISWPHEAFEFLGQVTTFGMATVILLGVGALRGYCRVELGRRLPDGSLREIAIVSLAKAAVPFAIVGAIVLWAFAVGEPGKIRSYVGSVDPVAAWEWTLSPPGLAKLILLSWLVGPIIEELVFRGFLYRAWERQWGWVTSLVLTSTCFSLFHPSAMASAFLGSVVYICVLRRTGSLRGCILVHIMYNVLVSWPVLGQLVFNDRGVDMNRLTAWSVPLACLVLVAVALPLYLGMSRTDLRSTEVR
jgi:membrane protease YdiL (CAAX protease family)